MNLKTHPMDRLDTFQIYQDLRTRFVGQALYLFPELESTNQTAIQLAQSQDRPEEGALVLSESQRQGRGRRGRHWFSPPGVNLYASLILYPRLNAIRSALVTSLVALSMVRAIQDLTGLKPSVKWPNDILIRQKKVSGILTEAGTLGDTLHYLVVGMGVNVNLVPADWPDDLRLQATSLQHELGQPVNRNRLMAALCNQIETQYLRLTAGDSDAILKELSGLCTTLGRQIRVNLSGRTVEGWGEGLDENGALILRTHGQNREVIHSGEVVHLREDQGA